MEQSFVRIFAAIGDLNPGLAKWLSQGVTHEHAHGIFIEISFGINSVLAVYQELRAYMRRGVTTEISTHVSRLQAWAQDTPSVDVTDAISRVTVKLERCEGRQTKISSAGIKCAAFCAIVAAAIMYLDLVSWVSWGCLLLILPLPIYWLASRCNYWRCLNYCRSESKKFDAAQEYLPKKLPTLNEQNGGQTH